MKDTIEEKIVEIALKKIHQGDGRLLKAEKAGEVVDDEDLKMMLE